MKTIAGQHHVSMITKDAQQNVHFYRDKLGLRFVKKTVNQDDPSMYHLFYGDANGSPGTELSFFEMPHAGRTYAGTNAITRISLLVRDMETLAYWKERFEHLGVEHGNLITYGGRWSLPFEDPDGLQLLLVNHNGKETPSFWRRWEKSPVPVEHQILGMGSVELTVRNPEKTEDLLANFFSYHEQSVSEDERIYQSVKGNANSEMVVKKLDTKKQKPGRGSVHHIAIRIADQSELRQWAKRVEEKGFRSSGIIDRHYFYSLYFRESNGILFELATDGPGFQADEPIEKLGETLALPPFLEERREEIEAKLKPIQ